LAQRMRTRRTIHRPEPAPAKRPKQVKIGQGYGPGLQVLALRKPHAENKPWQTEWWSTPAPPPAPTPSRLCTLHTPLHVQKETQHNTRYANSAAHTTTNLDVLMEQRVGLEAVPVPIAAALDHGVPQVVKQRWGHVRGSVAFGRPHTIQLLHRSVTRATRAAGMCRGRTSTDAPSAVRTGRHTRNPTIIPPSLAVAGARTLPPPPPVPKLPTPSGPKQQSSATHKGAKIRHYRGKHA
jgi:hypothetical protein